MLPWEKGETHTSVSLFIYEANMTVKEFYHSSAWSNTREAYKRSVGGLCERCLKKGLISAGAEVHHKVRLTPENVNDPGISLSWENLELLCESCHDAEHSSKRFTVDALGRVYPRSV